MLLVPFFDRRRAVVLVYFLLAFWEPDVIRFRVSLDDYLRGGECKLVIDRWNCLQFLLTQRARSQWQMRTDG
jgi:hypothetical protein